MISKKELAVAKDFAAAFFLRKSDNLLGIILLLNLFYNINQKAKAFKLKKSREEISMNVRINNLVVSNTNNEEYTAPYDNTPAFWETAPEAISETTPEISVQPATEDAVKEVEEAASVDSSSDEKRKEAETLNDDIIQRSKQVSADIIVLANLLKKMRDNKLYKELECKTFEQYCEEKAGISYRHAHRYISIVENISPEDLTTLSGLSVSKLMKIATLTPVEQKDLIDNNVLSSLSVRKLEEIIKEKTHTKKANRSDDRAFVNELGSTLPKRLKALSGKLESNEFENNDSITKCINTIAEAVAQLEKLMQADKVHKA